MICLIGSTAREIGGGGAVTDELDIDDAEDTEAGVRVGFTSDWGVTQLKLEPPILSEDMTICRAVVMTAMKRSCMLAIASFLLGRDATSTCEVVVDRRELVLTRSYRSRLDDLAGSFRRLRRNL